MTFEMNQLRYEVAADLSLGTLTHAQISNKHKISTSTISRWLTEPVFMAEVDELTIKCANATKAGLLRQLFKGLHIKEMNIADDKTSHLDYIKMIASMVKATDNDSAITIEFNIKEPPNMRIIKPDVIEDAHDTDDD